jgi:hypothetical protein
MPTSEKPACVPDGHGATLRDEQELTLGKPKIDTYGLRGPVLGSISDRNILTGDLSAGYRKVHQIQFLPFFCYPPE